MTEKQLSNFCNKEVNRLRKINDNIWKKHDEIYNSEGMEKASEYLGNDKKATSEKLNFFRNCQYAFEKLKEHKELIDDGGKRIQNYRKKFLTKFEKLIKSYDPDDNYKSFKEKRDSAFDENTDFLVYDMMFDNEDFIKYIDDVADYYKIENIINKFQVAIEVCYQKSHGKIIKNKALAKDCEALDRSISKLQNMIAKAKLSTNDLEEYYENASDMIDEYVYAKKIYENLSKRIKSKIGNKIKEYELDEEVNYFPY